MALARERDRKTSQAAPRRARGGFALPVAVLALVVVGVLVTTGFYMAQQESRVGIASQNGAMAFYIAEQGMHEVLANWSAARYAQIPLWDADTVEGGIPQGEYTVSVHHLTDLIYFLEAEGRVTRGGRLAGARRRMGLMAKITTAWINPEGALTTRGETRVGGTATVNGNDVVPPGWTDSCDTDALEDKAGVITDAAGTIEAIGMGEIRGSPDTLRDETIGDSTFLDYGDLKWEDLIELAKADGKDITSRGQSPGNPAPAVADGVCTTSAAMNWGEPWRSSAQGTGFRPECVDYFPLIYHEGPMSLQGTGRGQGILLVGKVEPDGTMSGDLQVQGNFTFLGIIIVLGTFDTHGSGPRVHGGVMAANANLAREDVIGDSRVQYSSCAVSQAILNNASLAKARPLLERSWVDLSNLGF